MYCGSLREQHGEQGRYCAAAVPWKTAQARHHRLAKLVATWVGVRPAVLLRAPVFQLEPHFWLELEGVVLQDLLYQFICVSILCRKGWVSGSAQAQNAGWDRVKLAHLSSLGCRPPAELLLLLVGLQVVLGSLLLGKGTHIHAQATGALF